MTSLMIVSTFLLFFVGSIVGLPSFLSTCKVKYAEIKKKRISKLVYHVIKNNFLQYFLCVFKNIINIAVFLNIILNLSKYKYYDYYSIVFC